MSSARLDVRRFAFVAALLGALTVPTALSAQSQLDVAQAQGFLGDWVIDMDTDMGPMTLNMKISDMAGKVGASVGSPDLGGMMDVTDITRSGDQLVLKYNIDAQGQMVDVLMSLVPDGDNLATSISAAGGQFMVDAVATRSGS